MRDIFRKGKEQGEAGDNYELPRQVSHAKQYSRTPFWSGVALDTINLNIRWHQTQLLPWDFAYAYVTSGLHTYFSDTLILA